MEANLDAELDLPEYDSYETLRQQLLTAITQGAEYVYPRSTRYLETLLILSLDILALPNLQIVPMSNFSSSLLLSSGFRGISGVGVFLSVA